jgi:hypothetical protein
MENMSIYRTRRQQVTTASGNVLQRQYIYMDDASWDALRQICIAQHRSGSQVIASLINIAAAQVGTRTEKRNEQTSPRTN